MTDDGKAAARTAVAARMAETRLNLTSLARAAKVDVKTVRGFVIDGRWPQTQTRASIAEALGWPSGALDVIAAGGELPDAAAPAEPTLADVLDRLDELASRVDMLERGRVATGLSVVRDEVSDVVAAHEEDGSITGEQEQPDTP